MSSVIFPSQDAMHVKNNDNNDNDDNSNTNYNNNDNNINKDDGSDENQHIYDTCNQPLISSYQFGVSQN